VPESPNTVIIRHIGVLGGDLVLRGYAGIGVGQAGAVSSIAIGGDEHVSIRCADVSGPSCLNGGEITLDGSVFIDAGSGRLGPIGAVVVSEDSSLLVTYKGTSVYEGIVGSSVLHIPVMPAIAQHGGSVLFAVKLLNWDATPFERTIQLALANAGSFLLNLPKNMDYQMTIRVDAELEQTLMTCNGSVIMHMSNEEVICYLWPFQSLTPSMSAYPTASFSDGMSFPVPIPRKIFAALGFVWFLDE
jgi:hypothetical protein